MQFGSEFKIIMTPLSGLFLYTQEMVIVAVMVKSMVSFKLIFFHIVRSSSICQFRIVIHLYIEHQIDVLFFFNHYLAFLGIVSPCSFLIVLM